MSAAVSTDINSLDLMNEVIEVDGQVDADQFFNPPLADDGEHEVIINLGNRGIKADRQKEGKEGKKTGPGLLNIHLQLKAAKDTGGEGGNVAFDQLTTVVMETNVGRTTRAHMVFDLAGFPLTEKSLGGLMAEMNTAVAQKPHVLVTTQWEAQIKIENAKQAEMYGKKIGEYGTVCRGQKKFPPLLDKDGNDTGRFDPEVLELESGQRIRAQVRVVKYARA
jgi:hypothetical protein